MDENELTGLGASHCQITEIRQLADGKVMIMTEYGEGFVLAPGESAIFGGTKITTDGQFVVIGEERRKPTIKGNPH